MEAPPLSSAPPISTATPATPAVYAAYVDSSPRTRRTNSWDVADPPPPKLRLMCSYGGHIITRPHDRTLYYAGGDTRIISIDRRTSLADLHRRLSKNLLDNQPFYLKYKLPNEDLDSLISVMGDEDLENMVVEYDRLTNCCGGTKHGRIRLFLFPKSSSTTKSEGWFFNALSHKVSYGSDRGYSDSSSVNFLLGLDDYFVAKTAAVVVKDVEAQIEGSKTVGTGNRILNGNSVGNQDVHSVPDSPMLETSSSSFDSTSSCPSVANPKTGGSGIEEQFQQMSVGVVGNVNSAQPAKQEEARVFTAAAVAAGTVVSGLPAVVGGEYAANRSSSDDERSDNGGYGKVQPIQAQVQQTHLQPLQTPEFHQMNFGVVGNVNSAPQPKQDDARVLTATAVSAATVVSGLPAVVGGEYAANRGSSDEERSDHGGYRKEQPIQPQVQQTHSQPQQTPEFHQMNFRVVGNVNSAPQPKQDDARVFTAAGVSAATVVSGFPAVVSGLPAVVGGEYATNRGSSDDERSDHGGYIKVQQLQAQVQQPQLQPLQTPQFQQNQIITSDLPSPDSISSEGSTTNPHTKQIQATHQEPVLQTQSSISPNHIVDPQTTDQNNKDQMQPQFQESGYVLSSQYDQNRITPQQFIRATNQYMPAGAVPIPTSYYPIYPSQEHHQPMLNHQYPIYYVPVNAPSSKPEMGGAVYRNTNTASVQYVGYSQMHHPSSGVNPNYSYEYADPTNHGQMYYPPLQHQLAAQYQNVASGPTVGTVPDASFAQQVRSSQP